MADNLNITSGAGVVVATDDVSSVHYQRIKLVDGNLDSTNATGVAVNPLIVAVSNSSATVSVLNTNATISVLNTLSIISVANTGGAVTVSNSGAYNVTVLNTNNTSTVSGGITLLSSVPITITGSTLISGGISILSGGTTSVMSGGITLLSSVPINITGTTLISGGISILSGGSSVVMSGGFTLLSSVPINITGTTLISGGITLLSAGTVLVSGGVTLLSSAPVTAKRDVINYIGCTPTWIYCALTSNNMTVIWAPVATKRFNITDITINTVSAATIYITQDTAATVTLMRLSLMDRGGWVSNYQTPLIASQTNHALVVQSTNTGSNGYVIVSGYESA